MQQDTKEFVWATIAPGLFITAIMVPILVFVVVLFVFMGTPEENKHRHEEMMECIKEHGTWHNQKNPNGAHCEFEHAK